MTRALSLQRLRVATIEEVEAVGCLQPTETPSALLSRLTSGSLLLKERGMIIYSSLQAAIPPAPGRRVPLRCVHCH